MHGRTVGTSQQQKGFSREALDAFIRNLTDRFAPEQVILFSSQARGDARQDSDADILVVMHDQGRPFDKTREICVAEDNPVVLE